MLTWSTSATTTAKPNRSRQSTVAHDFLRSWDSAVYEGKSIGDPDLDKEATLWREQFPHLRIIGVNIELGGGNRMTLPTKMMTQSKSAYTFREKNREFSLPRIDKSKKK